jgi:hypothetical protein
MILQAAGADIRRAANACEGLSISDEPELCAAVLDFKAGLRECDLSIAYRLTERRLPFLLYGAHAGGRCEAWPNAPLVSKWTSGAEIIEKLRALILPPQSGPCRSPRRLSAHQRRPGRAQCTPWLTLNPS